MQTTCRPAGPPRPPRAGPNTGPAGTFSASSAGVLAPVRIRLVLTTCLPEARFPNAGGCEHRELDYELSGPARPQTPAAQPGARTIRGRVHLPVLSGQPDS